MKYILQSLLNECALIVKVLYLTASGGHGPSTLRNVSS